MSDKKRTVLQWGVLLAAAVAALIVLAQFADNGERAGRWLQVPIETVGARHQANLPNDAKVQSPAGDTSEALVTDPARKIFFSGLTFAAVLLILSGAWHLNRRIHAVFKQLKESEARYRTMIQSMDEGIVVIDEQGSIRSINPAVEGLFGYQEDELLGKNVKHLMPPGYADMHDEFLSHYLQTGEKRVIGIGREVEGQRRDRSEFPMQLFVSEMEFDGRRMFLGIMHDISARKRAEAEVMQARARAEQAAAAKSQFLANVSHEIRTPMNGVLGMLELLSEARLETTQKEYVHMARQSAISLLKLIDDILDLSKIEAGRIELEREFVDLHELIEDAASIGSSLAIEKDLRLNCYIARGVPAQVRTDPARLRQVLLNLLSNAVKFTDRGEVNLRAELEEHRPDGIVVRLSISDTGIGIERAQLENLFEPFVQADSSITRRFGGTGLGLTISRHLVELLGGDIRASSEAGEGSSFTFTILVEAPAAEKPSPHRAVPESFRVLVVDDNATALENLRNYLREIGVNRVATGGHIDAARRIYQAAESDGHGFRLVLIKDPLKGAADLAACIRSTVRGAETRIVAMSPVKASKKRIKQLEADRTLARPVRRGDIQRLIADFALLPSVEPAVNDEPAVTGPPRDWCGVAVLLAEDNPVNQMVCRKMLEHFGIELEVVNNGEQAIELTAQRKFDLLLMDCQMPVMDGYVAARRIRERESANNLPRTTIVAVTAHAMEGDRERCLDAGMDGYIRKPYRLAELQEMLCRWLPKGSV